MYFRHFMLGLAATTMISGAANASVCDYRLSTMAGEFGAVSVGAAGAAPVALKAAGFYTLVHASSGLTMLGSTLAGASGAGTIGIIAGTGGLLGTIGAVLLAPVTIVLGGTAAVGIGGLETICYFLDERITDYDEVLAFMAHLTEHHPEDRFQLVKGLEGREDDLVRLWNPETEELDRFAVSQLYIVNGTLMYRRWGLNKNLGHIAFVGEIDEK